MGSKGNVNVSIWVPDSSVVSMRDEVADQSVARATAAAKKTFMPADSDGQIPVRTYDEDFDNALAAAAKYAKGTDGTDLLVIITDFQSNDHARAEQILADLPNTGDFVVIIPVSNQGYDKKWATKLDDTGPGADQVDVIPADELANEKVAYDEVGPWLAKVAA